MFLAHGHAYVYRIYGVYRCLNVSSEPDGVGAAVLVRAVEPLEGLDLMVRLRGRPDEPARALARGPGRLTAAFAIGSELDGIDLCAPDAPLWLGMPIG